MFEKRGGETPPLIVRIDGQPAEQDRWQRIRLIARGAFCHPAAHEHRCAGGIEGHDPSAVEHDPGAAAPFALVVQSLDPQPLIKYLVAAIEVFDDVIGTEENGPLVARRSKVDGFARRRANSGLGLGARSSSA